MTVLRWCLNGTEVEYDGETVSLELPWPRSKLIMGRSLILEVRFCEHVDNIQLIDKHSERGYNRVCVWANPYMNMQVAV